MLYGVHFLVLNLLFAPIGNVRPIAFSETRIDRYDAWESGFPNIILIVIDTLRADHLTTAGYARNTSPNMDRFANSAVVFSNTYSFAPWTLPAYSSLLLAKHAFKHNQNIYRGDKQEEPNSTILITPLEASGYKTVSIQTNGFLDVLDYNCDERYRLYKYSEFSLVDFLASNTALEWLNSKDNTDETFFMS